MNYKVIQYIECECGSDDHIMKFVLDYYDHYNPELNACFFLYQYKGFFKRLWTAIKYLFKDRCGSGHWDTIIISPEKADQIIQILNTYKKSFPKT